MNMAFVTMKTAKQAEYLVGKKFFVDGSNVTCVELRKTTDAKNSQSKKVQPPNKGMHSQVTNRPSQNLATIRDELLANHQISHPLSQHNDPVIQPAHSKLKSNDPSNIAVSGAFNQAASYNSSLKSPSPRNTVDLRKKHHIKPTSKKYFRLKSKQGDFNDHFDSDQSDY